jgi:hypothetical protein
MSEDFELQVGLMRFANFLKLASLLRTRVNFFYEDEYLCSWLACTLGESRSGLGCGRFQSDKQDKPDY